MARSWPKEMQVTIRLPSSNKMSSMPALAVNPDTAVVAPPALIAGMRSEFRRLAFEALEQVVLQGQRVLVLDLAATAEVDAAGLGLLLLLQKQGRESSVVVRLVNVRERVRSLLVVTRLDRRFEIA